MAIDLPGAAWRHSGLVLIRTLRLRFALWKDESRRNFRKGGRKGGRSQFRKTVQNEFKNAFTTPDSIRKHVRPVTANPVVAQVAHASCVVSLTREDAFAPKIRPEMGFRHRPMG